MVNAREDARDCSVLLDALFRPGGAEQIPTTFFLPRYAPIGRHRDWGTAEYQPR
jgi:hypothetical protein